MAIALKLRSASKLLAVLLILNNPCSGMNYVLPERGNIFGEIQYSQAESGETLSDVGIRYNLGFAEMIQANPGIDPHHPLAPGIRLKIPSQFTLPNIPRQGLVIDLAKYRLYYFPPNDNIVVTMPVGIGRDGFSTPTGSTTVVSKERDPVWRPTYGILKEARKKGIDLPEAFPGGEGNPLGRHVLRLGWPTYLIHGTNRRDGVGTRISAGCIRMLPEDIEYLYDLVKIGTPVRIINPPNDNKSNGKAVKLSNFR